MCCQMHPVSKERAPHLLHLLGGRIRIAVCGHVVILSICPPRQADDLWRGQRQRERTEHEHTGWHPHQPHLAFRCAWWWAAESEGLTRVALDGGDLKRKRGW